MENGALKTICVVTKTATETIAVRGLVPPTNSTSAGGTARSTFIFTETPSESRKKASGHLRLCAAKIAACAKSDATPSLNMRNTKIEWTRFESASVMSAYGGTTPLASRYVARVTARCATYAAKKMYCATRTFCASSHGASSAHPMITFLRMAYRYTNPAGYTRGPVSPLSLV